MKIPFVTRSAAAVAETPEEKAARQEALRHERHSLLAARRAESAAVKREAREAHARRKEEERARVQAEEAERHCTAARAYETYLRVRDWAGRMRDAGGSISLTDAETQTRSDLACLWNAAPEEIAALRRSSRALTGVDARDYEPGSPEAALELRSALGLFWRQLGRELFVPEPPLLGGFGYTKNGDLYNEDTVRFFTAIVALHDAAVLNAFRGTAKRRIVWEIGGGFGGFAYQFKTLCPNVTYVISPSPETALLSAVYLTTAFPNADVRFYDAASPAGPWDRWTDADFVFVPEHALSALRPPQVDLTIDLMTLRLMTPARAAAYVEHAFAFGSRFFYSMMPAAPAGASEHLWKVIERLYWPHPVPARSDQSRVEPNPSGPPPASDSPFEHLMAWKRLRV